MDYEKPNVTLVASAVKAVKSESKADVPTVDSLGDTIGAYESDE